ncbi:MAG: Gfo/Idh/MocA family oxidoreductase [Chloroflexota bacterium]|nr:Gfo/Idh/MocA family oxidoreductase [Chloroflexota bacterium]
MSLDGQLGIGLVGAGIFGAVCLDAFAAMPEVKIVGIADVDVAKARLIATKYSARAYASLDRILEDPYVNIVALMTPPYLHAEQSLAAVRAGKHVFCAKPLALNLPDAELILTTAEDQRVRVAMNYMLRFNPFYITVAALQQDAIMGALRHIDLTNHAAGRDIPPDHWFWDRARSGGIWLEHALPFLDVFAWIAGTSGEMLAAQHFARADGAIERVEAIARFGEAGAHLYHGFDQSTATERTTVRFTFENGYVTLREALPTVIEITTWVDSAPLMLYLPGSVTPEKRDGKSRRLRAYAPQGKSVVSRECIQNALRDLILCIRDLGRPTMISTADILNSLRLAQSVS